jgi:hypothetical protein
MDAWDAPRGGRSGDVLLRLARTRGIPIKYLIYQTPSIVSCVHEGVCSVAATDLMFPPE